MIYCVEKFTSREEKILNIIRLPTSIDNNCDYTSVSNVIEGKNPLRNNCPKSAGYCQM